MLPKKEGKPQSPEPCVSMKQGWRQWRREWEKQKGHIMGVIQAKTAPRVSQGCSISLFSPIKLGKMTVHLISIRKNGNLYNRKSHFLGEIDNFFYFVLVFFFTCMQCSVLHLSSPGWPVCSIKSLKKYQFREMVLAVTFCLCLVVVGLWAGNPLPTERGCLLQVLHGIHSLEGAGRLGQEIGMHSSAFFPTPWRNEVGLVSVASRKDLSWALMVLQPCS